jgi:hypothetical protein
MRVRFVCFLLPGALVVAACNTERSEPARRDLTLLPSAESATAAVVSARELDLPKPDAGVSSTSAVRAPTPAPARVHAQPAWKSDHSATVAPVPAPNAEPAPSSPAPGPKDAAVAGGAGTPLEPGQTVTLIPASAGAGAAPLPASDVSTEQGIRARPWIIIGDDRCIPGRGEVMPRGHRGWRSVTY